MNRREVLKAIPASIAMAKVIGNASMAEAQATSTPPAAKHFKQGITRQVFGNKFSIEDCCREAVKIGFQGFDFADDPADWPILKKYGLLQTMYRVDAPRPAVAPPPGTRPTKPAGWDAIAWKEAQGDFLKACEGGIDTCAANGFPNFLLQCGARSDDFSLEQGADNAVEFCNKLKARAEEKGVTLCMEILNGKGIGLIKTSMFDHTAWGVGVVKRVNSPRVKVLYDVWQADIMEGDVVQTIRDNIQHIAHIHTGGVPGRHEIDDTQELNYRFIAKAIADTGFTGFVTHEWSPAPGSDPLTTAKKAFEIMNV
jgi:hydroxypyruvate isomerase